MDIISHLYPLSDDDQPSDVEGTTIYAGFGQLFENIFSRSCQFYIFALTDPESQLIASQVLGLLGQPRKKKEERNGIRLCLLMFVMRVTYL